MCRSLKEYKMASLGLDSLMVLDRGLAKAALLFLERVSINVANEPFGSDVTLPTIRVGEQWKMPLISRLFVRIFREHRGAGGLGFGKPEGAPTPAIQSIDAPKPLHSDYEDLTGAMISFPRPQWTWDWDLPNLVSLELSVGFTLHLQFRMLQKCPNLRELILSIFSEEGRVERILTKEDFDVNPTAWNTEQRAA
ncbi:MAG: hypothetical protein BYD32DRAFT_437032 [Podila humilis]|nr:MAG: hypothetical protein BYD32DRAFT_437032 [Podila humilis]